MATANPPILNATVREGSGKGVARRLRREGFIPAICYGKGAENISLAIDPGEFEKITKHPTGLNTVFELQFDEGDKVESVMLRDYQIDPLRREVSHADFVVVDPEEPLVVRVPVTTTGRAAGVVMGGRLRFIHPTVEVAAQPGQIPTEITVDVTDLTPEGAIMAGELNYPEEVEPAFKVDHALIRIQMPRKKLDLGIEDEEASDGEEGGEEETTEEE